MDLEQIYQEHEKIGFPKISEKEQADILIWHNVEIINKLTPNFKAEIIPPAVAKKYVRLSKKRFRKYFIKSGYIEKLYERHINNPKLDSKWVEKTEDKKYQMIVQERGGIVNIKYFENYSAVIDYFVNWIYKTYDY